MSVVRNPNLGPSQMRLRKRRLFWIRFSIVLFFFLVIVFGLAIFSGHKSVIIHNVAVSGIASVKEEEILSVVDKNLSGRYFYLFSHRNFLIFPRFQIKEDLLSKIKTLKEVDVSWSDWGSILISVLERKPHSVWCGEDPMVIGPECFLVDSTGYIYKKAPVFSGYIYLKNYSSVLAGNTETDPGDPIGQYFLSSNIYHKIFNLIKILDQSDIRIISVYFNNPDYHFRLESGPEIIFNNENEFEQSFQNLFSAIETGNLDLEKEADKINYIDLRFDNKIIVGRK